MDMSEKLRLMQQEDEEFYGLEALRLEKERIFPSLSTPEATSKSTTKCTTSPKTTSAIENDAEVGSACFVVVPNRAKTDHFPGFMSRSALFRAAQTSNLVEEQPVQIPAQGCSIQVLGPRLSMRDKAVWEIAIQLAKETSIDMSQPFTISLREFVRRLGETDTSGAGLESIWQCLRRLSLARISFDIKGHCTGHGSIFSTAIKRAGVCYVRLNPDFVAQALTRDIQFKIDSPRRNSLAMHLAQWLHDFFSTHDPFKRDMDIAYLRNLCGYSGPKRNFPAKLQSAMTELSKAAPGLIQSFELIKATRDSDQWLLKVTRGSEIPRFELPAIAKRGRLAL